MIVPIHIPKNHHSIAFCMAIPGRVSRLSSEVPRQRQQRQHQKPTPETHHSRRH